MLPLARAITRVLLGVSAVVAALAAVTAHAQMLVVSTGDATGAPSSPGVYFAPDVVFPDFGGGSAPSFSYARHSPSLLPSPHGLAIVAANRALASRMGSNSVEVVDTTAAQTVDLIGLPGYNGFGTLAVNPARTHVLVLGEANKLWVIAAPFDHTAAQTSLTLPSTGDTATARMIAFHPTTGRAFLALVDGIAVVDPPYTSVAFTIPSPNGVALGLGGQPSTGSIAMTPDGATLVATGSDASKSLPDLRIFHAPFSAASVPEVLTIPGAQLRGMTFTPDGSRLLVTDFTTRTLPQLARVYSVAAPFGAASTYDTLLFDATGAFTGSKQSGFEDVDISADGQQAALGGGGSFDAGDPLVVLKAPFTSAGVTYTKVDLPLDPRPGFTGHGRGTGTARFWSTSIPALPAQIYVGANDVMSSIQVTEGNSGTTDVTIPVHLLVPSAQTVTVDYATVDYTAKVANNDYLPASGTLTFAPGETTKNIVVKIIGNTLYQSFRYFAVQLGNPFNAVLLSPETSLSFVTILDDDPAEPTAITTTALPDGAVGVPYSFQIQGTGMHPFTWAEVAGPPGLALDPATGILSGTPTTPGTALVRINLVDAAFGFATKDLTLTVTGVGQPGIAVSSPLDFDLWPVGATSDAMSAQVSSTGVGDLVLGNPIYTLPPGAEFLAATGVNACTPGQTLATGASCLLWFVFKPAQAGTRTLVLPIASNAGPNSLTLTGMGDGSGGADATLSALTVSSGSLVPAFASGTFAYADAVLSCTTSITVTPTLSDPAASVKVNGLATTSGSPSAPISLAFGDTPVNVLVTAKDGVTTQSYALTVTRPAPAALTPVLQGAVSRKAHGAAGTFDLPLSLVDVHNPSTEPRRGPAHTIVFHYDKAITSVVASVVEGTAIAGTPTISGSDVILDLTGVSDRQYVTVQLANVASADGGTGGCGIARLGLLAGDVNQSRVVSVADLGLVNAQLSLVTTPANYLRDVNASGTITVADKGITNANLTRALPAP